jgi:ASCH domain
MEAEYALSLKQPWAALVVAGRKTIEVRRWPTARRGRVLIHAGRVADGRPEAWAHVDAALRTLTELRGGIIGAAELTDCLVYTSQERFVKDQPLHRNDPSWFEPAGLYGFTFANPVVLPFRRCPGWFRLFTVAPAGADQPAIPSDA